MRRVRYEPWPPAWLVGAAPPLWVNGKPDSTNPRKGCTAFVGALRPELFVVLAGMQVNESHPLASFKVSEAAEAVGRATATQDLRGGGLLSTSRAFTAPFCNFPSFVRPRGSKKKEKGAAI